jgi:phosphopantothenoylcysteine decarboxylase
MSKILLGVTGSVAAIKLPDLVAAFQQAGHEVKIVATETSKYFFDPSPFRSQITFDEDEWPNSKYQRGDNVPHIDLRKWADLFCIAPLDANTLAKLSIGICDNTLTCVWRAWDLSKPIIVAPAMNTFMWNHPLTKQHLKFLGSLFGASHVPGHLNDLDLINQINARSMRFKIVSPISKMLACGDEGMGAMASVDDILKTVNDTLNATV